MWLNGVGLGGFWWVDRRGWVDPTEPPLNFVSEKLFCMLSKLGLWPRVSKKIPFMCVWIVVPIRACGVHVHVYVEFLSLGRNSKLSRILST